MDIIKFISANTGVINTIATAVMAFMAWATWYASSKPYREKRRFTSITKNHMIAILKYYKENGMEDINKVNAWNEYGAYYYNISLKLMEKSHVVVGGILTGKGTCL